MGPCTQTRVCVCVCVCVRVCTHRSVSLWAYLQALVHSPLCAEAPSCGLNLCVPACLCLVLPVTCMCMCLSSCVCRIGVCLCKHVCMDPSMCVWLAGWFVVYPLFPSFLILASLSFGTLLWFPPLGPGRYRQERAQLGLPGLSGQRSGSIPGLGRKACSRDRGFLPGLGPLCLWPSVSTWRSHLCLQGFLPEPPFQDFSSDGPTKDLCPPHAYMAASTSCSWEIPFLQGQ